ncbi:hypothetical protein C8R44DRAFT_863849 [Mycena epipterygia]|nr:hypothetical protein C8R44DRAFT_863849 [Mycena epipterygia]
MLSELDLSLGALEIGVLLSSTLWGVTTVQLYVYLTSQNKDPLWTRLLVYFVWILESLHTIFAWIYIYRLTVTFYGVPAALGEAHWTLDTSSLFDGIIGACVQMFFAYRIRMFANSWPVTLVSWLGSLLQLSCTLGVTILSGEVSVAEFGVRYGWIVESLLIINLIVDIINTSALSYYLNRGRTGFKGTDQVLEKLVIWTIETGLITAVAAAVQLILFKVMPTSGKSPEVAYTTSPQINTFHFFLALWIGISLFYAKLYSNSFLAILNSRSIIRQGFTTNAQTGSGLNRSWNTTTTGVHVTVVQGQQDDLELGRVKRMNDKSNLDL